MILSASIFNKSFETTEGEIPIFIIENPRYYQKFVSSLLSELNGIESEYGFYVCDKEIKMQKEADVILDLFNLDINKSKNLTKLYSQLQSEYADEMFYEETQKLNSEIMKRVSAICFECDYELIYDEKIYFSDLFKCINLKFDYENEALIENLANYIKIMNRFLGKKLFIIFGFKNVFSEDEQLEFYKFLNYYKIEVLIVENTDVNKRLKYEKYRIIDEDLCVIY